jgi:hypothetical protein
MRKGLISIGLIALLWISVIHSGELGSDTGFRLQMAHAWVTGAEEVNPNYQPRYRGDIEAGVLGRGGRRYIAYDVGQSLLMLPGDWLGTQLPKWLSVNLSDYLSEILREWIISFFIFIPINVAVVLSCFWHLKLFKFHQRVAELASIICLLGTTIFYYAQGGQQNNQILLFAILGYATALKYVKCRQSRFAILSGLASSAAVLTRMTSAIHALTILLFLLGCIAYRSRNKLTVIHAIGLWIAGFVPFIILGRIIDYVRYGSFWVTGQSLSAQQLNTDPIWSGLPTLPDNYPLINDPHVGILGVLFSPAKSIFIYDPLLLPCLALGFSLWRKLSPEMKWYLITGILNLSLFIIMTSRLHFWHGDWGWGARYHVTSVHLLLIPLIGLFVESLLSIKRPLKKLFQIILAVAIVVQIASIAMPTGLEVIQSKRIDSRSQPSELGIEFDYDSEPHFRLGQRLRNIVCLINSSISDECVSNLRLNPDRMYSLQKRNTLAFFPFELRKMAMGDRGNPGLVKISIGVLLFWVTILVTAIFTTVRFYNLEDVWKFPATHFR